MKLGVGDEHSADGVGDMFIQPNVANCPPKA